MKYFEFIDSFSTHFKSVRLLKGYLSFDLYFPVNWVTEDLNKDVSISVIEGEGDGKVKVVSFVCKKEKKEIEEIEKLINKVIKYNREREEKKSLFNEKVNELKLIFENSKIDDLRNLKVNLDAEEDLNYEPKMVLEDDTE